LRIPRVLSIKKCIQNRHCHVKLRMISWNCIARFVARMSKIQFSNFTLITLGFCIFFIFNHVLCLRWMKETTMVYKIRVWFYMSDWPCIHNTYTIAKNIFFSSIHVIKERRIMRNHVSEIILFIMVHEQKMFN
jgi:hypothetical protein